MGLVVDDLAAWLVGLLAEAGRKKLTTLVLGDAQERALQQAARAAVKDTADALSPSDSRRAGQITMVIGEVFRAPVPDTPLGGAITLAEGLQAGIASQLAQLEDVGLTGTWQSSAEVLGVPGTVMADLLTGHLMREIMLRGSRGGPLTPLADQLNHDLTHLQVRRVEVQGQRVEGMLARLAEEVRDALVRPGTDAAAAGRPLDEVTDPFLLEVHRPVQPEDPQSGLPVLPTYVPREHDVELGSVVRASAEGSNGIAVLVGGSSTGKTRACWEVLRLLRDEKPGWRLWHPIDPSRPEAFLRELPGIGPRTVVWLNEAQFYLDDPGGLGERVAAGLRELLRGRGPVLVLATLWPSFWDALTTLSKDGADPHAQARELLAGRDITVPAAFTGPQLHRLSESGDVRLAQAAQTAQDGQVVQFLAGAPELLARYRNAPPAAAALIHTAMDARRLGMRRALPYAFLEAASLGYLTDSDWDQLDEDWLEQALAYTAVPCKGVRGPLTRIRPRSARTAGSFPGRSIGVTYQLADYLDQHGRATRRDQIPPPTFWSAAASHVDPGELRGLGQAAHDRGLCRHAAQLYKNATAHGDTLAAAHLVSDLNSLHPADQQAARWSAAHAFLDDPSAAAVLLRALREAGAEEEAATLLARGPAAYAALDNLGGVADLLRALRQAGAGEQVTALAGRAAAHVALDDPGGAGFLMRALREVGAGEQVTTLAGHAATHASLDNLYALASLLHALREVGAEEQVTILARRAAAHVALDDPGGVGILMRALRRAGAKEQVPALLARDPAAHVALDDLEGIGGLLRVLREEGAAQQFTALAGREIAHTALHDPYSVAVCVGTLCAADAKAQVTKLVGRTALNYPDGIALLLEVLLEAGAEEQVTTLLARDPAAHAALNDPFGVADLLRALRQAGAEEQVTTLLARDPAADVALDNPRGVTILLWALRQAGAKEQVMTLLARNPAAYAALNDPDGIGLLLHALQEAGAEEQFTTLAGRAAAHTALNHPRVVASLLLALRQAGAGEQVTTLLARDPATHAALDKPNFVVDLLRALREAGAQEQAEVLIDRLPGAGMFQLFCDQDGHQEKFRFGREADGSPAVRWNWEDLD